MLDRLAQHWGLDPDITFLNHGSFGACPKVVLAAQQELRREVERQPVEFFVRRWFDRLDAAREILAEFVGADPAGLVAVPNATTGVNIVARSLELAAGDELLVHDHAYNACRNALDHVARRAGARLVVARVPFPLSGPDDVVEAMLTAVTERTRFAMIDHVTSQTGLIFPVVELVQRLAERGVDTLVDGAHAPGMLALDIREIGAAYYTGNCHKWLCAPKAAGFLWAREDRRDGVRPLTISHGYNTPRPGRSRLHDEFDWAGTIDPTPFLSVPAAIELMGTLLPGGWSEVMRRNRTLALAARRRLARALAIEPPCPDAMIGTLVSLPLPDGSPEPPASPLYTDPLQDELLYAHRIEVPVIPWPAPPRRLLRVSAQLYNNEQQYRRLADLLPGVLRGRRPDD